MEKAGKQRSIMAEIKTFKLDTPERQIAFIESILFVSKDPLEPERIMNFLNCRSIKNFEKIISAMEVSYQKENRGIILNRSGWGLQLVTKPEIHEHLTEFFTVKTSSKLTIPSLETLSIVAYRQPVTIPEISDLRGVNSISPVKNLLQKKLIKISGRKKIPGLPLLYSTTQEFLLYFGLNDLSELPSLEELTEMFEEKEQPSLFKNKK
jgi:segregation and condensation protein B